MEHIGFIGIGAMGWHMATNLSRAGHRVTVYDADRARQERFVRERNGHGAQTLAELGASADVVITMLPTGPIVRQVLEQQEGGALAKSLRCGTIVVDMSSSEPTGTRMLAAKLEQIGVTLIDAPVSGGVQGAEAGQLVLMIGCDDAKALARVRPVLDVLGKKQLRGRRVGCRACNEGAEQLHEWHRISRRDRGAGHRTKVRPRSGRDDGRHQRVRPVAISTLPMSCARM